MQEKLATLMKLKDGTKTAQTNHVLAIQLACPNELEQIVSHPMMTIVQLLDLCLSKLQTSEPQNSEAKY
jgi:hypothetical protein